MDGGDRARDRELAGELLRSRQAQGSYEITRATLFLIATTVPFVAYVWLVINPSLAPRLATIVVVMAGYESGMLLAYRRGLYRPWLDWVNATVEISAVSAVIVMDAQMQGPEYAFTSAPAFIYAIAILVSAVRLRRALSIYTGVLASVSYFALYLVYRDRIDPTLLERLPSLQAWNVGQRSIFLAFAGFVAYLVSVLMRRNIGELIASLRRRLRAEETLGRHVSRPVAALLVDTSSTQLGEERAITVLFADIRAFTRFSEERSPAGVVAFLNDFLDRAAESVERHGGIVNKFTGDGLMAIFGAPRDDADHAAGAARAAVDIQRDLRAVATERNLPDLRLGIGLHSGPAVVGLVGSASRSEYTAIGDTVNLAARIEELTKTFDADILLSDATREALGERAVVRSVGEVDIRGRAQPVKLHALIEIAS